MHRQTADPTETVTRSDWEAEADRWLLTAREHARAGGALICPPGPPSQSGPLSDGIEGFARSFLIAAARLAGADDGDPHGHAQFYADGLAAAMRPGAPGHWPRAVAGADYPHAGITQPAVEAANLAFGLALCREQLWDRLDEAVRAPLTDWLLHHARLRVWDSNWLLFPAIVEAFLGSVGVGVPGGRGAESVERVESWYLGHGWYNDGPPAEPGRNLDHYNSWVIQPFLWQWYRLRGEAGPAGRTARFQDRLRAFAATNALLFAPDGAPLHQGRSLTYRHAVLGGLWTAALAGVDPLPPGSLRALAGRTLRYFDRLGADGGTPPALGWAGPEFLPATQVYSGPGSPYFAGMGFLGLAAPADHPLWAAEPAEAAEADGSAEADARPSPGGGKATRRGEGRGRGRVTVWPALGWLVQHDRADGIVRVVNHGSDHVTSANDLGDPHYAAFAYSTHTAPGTGAAWADRAWAGGVDGHLALVDGWGRATRRGRIMGSRAGEGYAASWHLPRLAPSGLPLPGARVVTASIVDGPFELRCHLVTSPAGWTVREGGHAVAGTPAPPAAGAGDAPDGPVAWACAGGVRSAVLALHGYRPGGGAVARHVGANAFGVHSAAPYLTGPATAGAASVHVALHLLDRTEAPDGGLPDPAGIVAVEVAGSVVTARWADGPTAALDLGGLFPEPDRPTGEGPSAASRPPT